MISRPLPILLLVFACSCLFQIQNTSAQNTYQKAINAFLQNSNLKSASVSISLVDVESGTLIASHQPDLSISPASSLKVLTTGTALKLLGADYRFKTELQYDGQITNEGILEGNIYLKGYGDPTLGSDQMEEAEDMNQVLEKFRMALQQKGIRKINGYIIGDGSHFGTDVNCDTWQWNDLGNYYAAGAWGLNLHENLYYLRFRQRTQVGQRPGIARIEPEVEGLEFYNEIRSAGRNTGDNAYIYGAPYNYTRQLRGTIPAGNGLFSIKGSIPDAPKFAAQQLQNSLEEIGITSSKGAISFLEFKERNSNTENRTLIYKYNSPPLSAIITRANMKSVNLYCESLLKTISKAKGGNGSFESGTDVIKKYWEDRGLSMAGIFLEDGSGLSARNAVTSRFMAQLLRKLNKDTDFEAFYDSLPQAGRTGSLKNTLKGTSAEGRLRAKSGTLKRVRSFTGYARSKSGALRSFSIIVNDFSGSGAVMRRKIEQLMLAFCQ